MPVIKQGIVYDVKQQVDEASFKKTEALIKKGDALLAKADADAIKRLEAQKRAIDAATKAQQNYQTALSSITSQSAKNMLLGQRISMLGGTILAPFLLSLKSFVDKAGEGDAVANRWKNSMESLASSSQDVGRVVANELNPALEKTAALVADAVNALEKNPELAGSILRIGGGLTAGGAAFSGLSMLSQTFANAGNLKAAQAAGKLGTVALTATAVYLGAEAGLALGNTINKLLGVEAQDWSDIGNTAKRAFLLPFLAGAEALKKLGFDKEASQLQGLVNSTVELGNAAEDTSYKAKAAAGIVSTYAKEAQAGAEKSARIAERAKVQIEKQAQASEKLTQLKKQESDALEAFNRANADAVAKRIADERAARAQANLDAQRAERSHANAIKKIKRDGQRAEAEATANRDALALEEAKRNTQDQLAEENDRYAEEKRTLRENLNIRLREIAQNFEAERNRRLQEFQYAQQIRQLEIQAAQNMVARIAAILAGIYSAPGVGSGDGPVYGSSNAASAVAQYRNPTASAQSANANISVSGGGMNVIEVKKIARATIGGAMSQLERELKGAY